MGLHRTLRRTAAGHDQPESTVHPRAFAWEPADRSARAPSRGTTGRTCPLPDRLGSREAVGFRKPRGDRAAAQRRLASMTSQPGPPGRLLNFDRTQPPPVPRDAATLVLLRDGGEGIEVFCVERNRKSRFMGGALVFP